MSIRWLIRAAILLPMLFLSDVTPAAAQVGDVVDPVTGNYVPGKDPFGPPPKPRTISPLRVNRRLTNRVDRSEGGTDPTAATGGQTQKPTQAQAQAQTSDTPEPPESNALRHPDWWPK